MDVLDILLYSTAYVSLFVSMFWFTVYFFDEKKPQKTASQLLGITMLVPAHNEQKTIKKCVISLLQQGYPKLTVLVVDDGSTDATPKIVKALARRHKNVKYLGKKHSGKAASLNFGLRRVKTEVFGFIDSDTYLSSGALHNMVSYFRDEKTASVTVCIKPSKTLNFVQKIQRVEYMISAFTRKLLSMINSVYYTPGCAIYRTNIVREVGGFDENNLTEDLEIGLRLKNSGYRIENTIEKFAYTEVPSTFRDLFHQRMRWYRGYIHNTRKYKHMFFSKRFGDLGLMVLPIQYILLALVTPFLLYGIYDSSVSALRYITDAYLVGFDFSYFVGTFSFNLITPTTFFFAAVLAAFVMMLRLSQEKTSEKIGKATYVAYIILYPFINTLLWMSAFVYEMTGTKKRW